MHIAASLAIVRSSVGGGLWELRVEDAPETLWVHATGYQLVVSDSLDARVVLHGGLERLVEVVRVGDGETHDLWSLPLYIERVLPLVVVPY